MPIAKSNYRRTATSWDRSAELNSKTLVASRGGFVEITLSFPARNIENLYSHKQRQLYSLLYDEIRNTIDIRCVHLIGYEFNKSGNIHLHSIMYIPPDKVLYAVGAVGDISKRAYEVYSKFVKHSKRQPKYNAKCLNTMELYYRSPLINVCYRDARNYERLVKFSDYVLKDYDNSIALIKAEDFSVAMLENDFFNEDQARQYVVDVMAERVQN